MRICWICTQKLGRLLTVFGLAFWLSGIERTGKESKFEISDLSPGGGLGDITPEVMIGAGIGMGVLILLIIILALINSSRKKKKIAQMSDDRARMQLETELTNRGVGDSGRELLERLGGSTNPEVLLPIIQDNGKFGTKILAAQEAQKLSPIDMANLHALRHQLGFTFSNIEVPFLSTKMLESGQKLQGVLKKDEHTSGFKSVILETDETHLQIKPPTFKGKPANLKSFPGIVCQLRRERDAIYEAIFRVVGQKKKAPFGVILEQTDKIRKVRDLTVIEDGQMSEIDDWVDSLVQDHAPAAKHSKNKTEETK